MLALGGWFLCFFEWVIYIGWLNSGFFVLGSRMKGNLGWGEVEIQVAGLLIVDRSSAILLSVSLACTGEGREAGRRFYSSLAAGFFRRRCSWVLASVIFFEWVVMLGS